MTQINGEPLDFSKAGPFIISNPGCYDDMIRILNEGRGYSRVVIISSVVNVYFINYIKLAL